MLEENAYIELHFWLKTDDAALLEEMRDYVNGLPASEFEPLAVSALDQTPLMKKHGVEWNLCDGAEGRAVCAVAQSAAEAAVCAVAQSAAEAAVCAVAQSAAEAAVTFVRSTLDENTLYVLMVVSPCSMDDEDCDVVRVAPDSDLSYQVGSVRVYADETELEWYSAKSESHSSDIEPAERFVDYDWAYSVGEEPCPMLASTEDMLADFKEVWGIEAEDVDDLMDGLYAAIEDGDCPPGINPNYQFISELRER